MSSYVIAGKADDPSFARAEYAAKQIEVSCPGVYFKLEMKHPDAWKEFITSVFRKYDFDGYSDDFAGPLVWTHEGDLVGSSADFVQKVCIDKFGMGTPPVVTDPMFKMIAADNLKQVQRELYRKANGLPFSERVEAAAARAKSRGFLELPVYEEQRRRVIGGTSFEVWISPKPDEDLATESLPPWSSARLRQEYGDSGKAAQLSAGLAATTAGGKEQSHLVVLHPRPLVKKHLVLPKRRHCREVVPQSVKETENADACEGEEEANVTVATNTTTDVDEDGATITKTVKTTTSVSSAAKASATSDQEQAAENGIFDFGEGTESRIIEVPPSTYRSTPDEDLGEEDFSAAMEALLSVGGVATWMGLRGGTEYRHPVDTHVQVLPFPLHTLGEDSPLRYPLELALERAVREGEASLPVFKFKHTLVAIKEAEAGKNKVAELAKNALAAFESARGRSRSSCLLAFTSTWLLLVPLQEPPEFGTLHHQAWLQLPPPHPCALVGVILVEAFATAYPEAASLSIKEDGPLVSNRAFQEGIPEGSPEYEVAQKEARISMKILDRPADLLAMWAVPC